MHFSFIFLFSIIFLLKQNDLENFPDNKQKKMTALPTKTRHLPHPLFYLVGAAPATRRLPERERRVRREEKLAPVAVVGGGAVAGPLAWRQALPRRLVKLGPGARRLGARRRDRARVHPRRRDTQECPGVARAAFRVGGVGDLLGLLRRRRQPVAPRCRRRPRRRLRLPLLARAVGCLGWGEPGTGGGVLAEQVLAEGVRFGASERVEAVVVDRRRRRGRG